MQHVSATGSFTAAIDNSNTDPVISATTVLNRNGATRKRARKACLLCHERKVRCDVSLHGVPCTNCRLDSHPCSVPTISRRRPKKRILPMEPSSQESVPIDADKVFNTQAESVSEDCQSLALSWTGTNDFAPNVDEDVLQFDSWDHLNVSFHGVKEILDPSKLMSAPLPDPTISQPILSKSLPSTGSNLIAQSNMPFSYYRFLEVAELSRVLPDDVRYLEMKGCLHLPLRPQLDHFIRHYFLYVHPCMPLLDEDWFLSIYASTRTREKIADRIPLLLVQAMLFAASPFVSLATIHACGFSDYITARAALHQRAKLLLDFQAEADYATISQASLLLSLECSPEKMQDNSSWLSNSIQYARADNAHLYYCLPNLDTRQIRNKKRLWWCCVLRDRVIALGCRRHILITPVHFDFTQEGLTENDFEPTHTQYSVYDGPTQRSLSRIFIAQCQFAVAVTATLVLAYPLDGVGRAAQLATFQSQVNCSRKQLENWMENAQMHLNYGQGGDSPTHRSITLYTDLTFVYYHSAQVALYHHTMYTLNETYSSSPEYHQLLQDNQSDLEHGVMNITKKVTNIVRMGLIAHLPVTVVAYVALPLALSSLDVKLQPKGSQRLIRHQQLDVYMEAMKHFGYRFNLVGFISTVVTRLLQLVDSQQFHSLEDHGRPEISQGTVINSAPRGWAEAVTRMPRLYSRLSASLDFALARGKYPRDEELPSWIIKPLKQTEEYPTYGQHFEVFGQFSDPFLASDLSNRMQHDSIERTPQHEESEDELLESVVKTPINYEDLDFGNDEQQESLEFPDYSLANSPLNFNMLADVFNLPATGG